MVRRPEHLVIAVLTEVSPVKTIPNVNREKKLARRTLAWCT